MSRAAITGLLTTIVLSTPVAAQGWFSSERGDFVATCEKGNPKTECECIFPFLSKAVSGDQLKFMAAVFGDDKRRQMELLEKHGMLWEAATRGAAGQALREAMPKCKK
ncbi:MAG: hypothetical protein ABL901_02685 [Hyphomicrobiaceae bacterium]